MSRSALAQLLIFVSLVAGLAAQRDPGTPQLIKDLDTRPLPPVSSWPAGFAADGAVLWFAADDGVHGTELFRSLGTPQSTSLVADLYPGAGGSRPTQITPFAGRVFFLADDGTHGLEPHCSDGTSGGTTRLGDFAPGATSSWVPRAFAFGTSIVFSIDDGTHGLEPWISDGTASGTRLLLDVVPGRGGSSWWGHVARELNGQPCIEFVALNGGSVELWRSDGTGAGTRLVAPLSGTQMVSRIGILPDGRSALWTGRAGNALQTLWVSDGTTANTVALTTTLANFAPTYPAVFDGSLFFAVSPYGAVATDGTAGGTRVIVGGATSPLPVHRFIGVMGGDLWGIPDWTSVAAVFEIIRIRSGQSVAQRVPVDAGILSQYSTDLPPIDIAGSRFVFWSWSRELVAFDPASSSTVSLAPAPTHPNSTHIGVGGRVWFQLNDATAGVELGVTDGTPGGTRLAVNIARDDGRPNSGSGTSRYAAGARGAMFMTPNVLDYTVWRSDGTARGTLPAHSVSGEHITQFGAGDIDYIVERAWPQDRLFASRRGQAFNEIALPPGSGATRQFGKWLSFRDSLLLDVQSWDFSPSGVLSVHATGASAWVTGNTTRLAARLGERLLLASVSSTFPWFIGTRFTLGLLSSDGTAQGTHGLAKIEQSRSAVDLPFVVFRDRAWFLALDQDATEQLASIDGSSGRVTMHGPLRPAVSDNGVLAIAALEDTIVLLDRTNAWFCDGRSPPRNLTLRSQPLSGTTSIISLGARALIEVRDSTDHVLGIDPAFGTFWTIPLPSSPVDKPLVIGRDRALLRVNVGGSAGPARYETWITDGTAAGTRRSTLPELFSTPVISRGRIFAPAFDPIANVEPHVSDAGATVTRLEEGCGGTRSPTLDALADPILGSTMPVRGQSRAGAIAFLMLSVAPLSPPPLLGTPCRFHVDPAAFTIQGSYPLVNGEFRTSLPIPADPAFRGFEVVLQFVAGPSDATLGADLSNGLLLRLGS